MSKKRFSKSLRKYFRQEKARIRREVLALAEQQKLINELYEKFGFKKETSGGATTSLYAIRDSRSPG